MSEINDENRPKKKIEEASLRAKSSRYYDPEYAAYARQVGEEVLRTRKPFDRAKFEELIDNDPLLSNLRLLPKTDD